MISRYRIKVIEGDFGDDQPIFKIVIVDDEGLARELGAERVNPGFGVNEKEAIDDFIRRNKSDVLDVVFDL